MAQIIDTLITEYRMKNQQYLQGASQVTQATQRTAKSTNMAQSVISGMGGNLGKLGSIAAGVATAITGVAIGAAMLGKSAFEQYAAFDSLVKALESVEGSAEKAKLAIADLKRIAKAPGIGFEEAVRAYTGLRNARVGGGLAESLIAGIGNANARSGGGVEQFGRAMLAIQQIAMKQYLQGEELLQLMEAGIPVQGLMQDRFGTTDTEQLKKQGVTSAMVLAALSEELAKLPKAAGGAQNTLDNFSDSIKFAFINAGSGLASVQGPLDKFAESISTLTDANVWADAVTMFANALGLIPSSSADAEDGLLRVAAGFVGFGVFLQNFIEGMKEFAIASLGPIGQMIASQLGSGKGDIAKFFQDAYGITAANDFYKDKRAEIDRLKAGQAGTANQPSGQGGKKMNAQDALNSVIGALEKKISENNQSDQSFGGGGDAMSETADNTKKLVELQKEQLDFQRALIGGGQVAQAAFSGLQVANATGGAASPAERKAMMAIKEWFGEIQGSNQIRASRTYGYR
jgi:tape measure domain-containing protein